MVWGRFIVLSLILVVCEPKNKQKMAAKHIPSIRR